MAIIRVSNSSETRARTELLGSVGAGVLGAGLALLFREALASLVAPLLAAGATVHGVAMYQKHQLDSTSGVTQPRWTAWTYRGCWLLLVALAGYGWWLHART